MGLKGYIPVKGMKKYRGLRVCTTGSLLVQDWKINEYSLCLGSVLDRSKMTTRGKFLVSISEFREHLHHYTF